MINFSYGDAFITVTYCEIGPNELSLTYYYGNSKCSEWYVSKNKIFYVRTDEEELINLLIESQMFDYNVNDEFGYFTLNEIGILHLV